MTQSVEQMVTSHQDELTALMTRLEVKLQNDPESLTLNEWIMLISVFDQQKFGHIPQTGTMLKAFKELGELCDDPSDGSEYADVLILVASLAGRNKVWNVARGLRDKLIKIRGQNFVFRADGTGNRVKGPDEK